MDRDRLGVVVIGRNEGERLRCCLSSVLLHSQHVVYVDSGSTDGSDALARAMGAEVVTLNLSVPFTAARARNEGFFQLTCGDNEIEFVQFVDGDCEVVNSWIQTAVRFLDENPVVAVVCGRRRERYPDRSPYNRMCDMEWNTPVGEAKACGGDALMRVSAFAAVRGYRADLIAGEEPELCVRLRAAGHRVWRLDADMTWHDAAMTRFYQWWKRTQRGGHAFAEGAWLHGGAPERHWVRERNRAVLWGVVLPGGTALLTLLAGPLALLPLAIYPLQVIRLAVRGALSSRENWILAFFLVLGKFPEAHGVLKFVLNRVFGHQSRLIEYK